MKILKCFVGCFLIMLLFAHLGAMQEYAYHTLDDSAHSDDEVVVEINDESSDVELGSVPTYAFVAQQLGFIDPHPSFLKRLCRFSRSLDAPLSTASEFIWVVTTLMWFKIGDMDDGRNSIEILLPTLLISSVVWLLNGANRLVASYLSEDIEGFLERLETFVATWPKHKLSTPDGLWPTINFFAEEYASNHSFLRNNRALVVDFYNRVAAGYASEVGPQVL